MTVNAQDLCEYQGQLYHVKVPSASFAWWVPPTSGREDLLALVPKATTLRSSCWRGCIGLFFLEERFLLRALAVLPPNGDIPSNPDWVARQGNGRILDWTKAGPGTEGFVEYTFTRPHEIPFQKLRLYDLDRGRLVHEIGGVA